ncbi:hypothetical protein TKK_0002347 [Trichogramma kaykai]
MHRFPGERDNSWVYHYKRYSYKHDDRGSHKIYRCKGDKWPRFKLHVTLDNQCFDVLLLLHPVHPQNLVIVSSGGGVIKEVTRRAHDKAVRANDLMFRFRPILRHKECSFDFCGRLMNKWKKEKMPPYPKYMKELHELILGYDPILPFFKGMATGTDGSIALIFINDIMLTPLNECSQLFCDGTFQCRPRLPKCAQLYTIHFRKIDKVSMSEADQIEEVAHSETAMEIETREIAQSNGTETDEERSEAEVEEVNSAFNRIEQMDKVTPAEQRAVVPAEQGTMASAEHAAQAPVVLPRQAEIAPQRKKRKRGCKSSKIRGNILCKNNIVWFMDLDRLYESCRVWFMDLDLLYKFGKWSMGLDQIFEYCVICLLN